uniref:7TM_GPCR_Srx domain-containing protein n=1 Tax=Steinernema glaseri TaxID=37863 RepID=A0A1I7ZXW3_9BILA
MKIICDLEYPQIHTCLVVLNWAVNIPLHVAYIIPCCLARTDQGIFFRYKFLTPFLAELFKVLAYYYQAILCATLVVYGILGGYLIYMKRKMGSVSTAKGEVRILLPAFMRFVSDMLLTVLWNYTPFKLTPSTRLAIALT